MRCHWTNCMSQMRQRGFGWSPWSPNKRMAEPGAAGPGKRDRARSYFKHRLLWIPASWPRELFLGPFRLFQAWFLTFLFLPFLPPTVPHTEEPQRKPVPQNFVLIPKGVLLVLTRQDLPCSSPVELYQLTNWLYNNPNDFKRPLKSGLN